MENFKNIEEMTEEEKLEEIKTLKIERDRLLAEKHQLVYEKVKLLHNEICDNIKEMQTLLPDGIYAKYDFWVDGDVMDKMLKECYPELYELADSYSDNGE